MEGESYDDDEGDRKFTVEIDKLKGGAKPGLRHTTVFIVGDEGKLLFVCLFTSIPLTLHKYVYEPYCITLFQFFLYRQYVTSNCAPTNCVMSEKKVPK